MSMGSSSSWMSIALVVIAIWVLVLPGVMPVQEAGAQASEPTGRIAYIRDGNVWVWSPDGTDALTSPGDALDPTWSPDGEQVLFVQDGGSYSNLVIHDVADGRTLRITDNEAYVERGSPDYVATSAWALDPSWSASGTIAFASDKGSSDHLMQLWLMDSVRDTPYLAPYDGGDSGSIEQIALSADGDLAAYTVLASGGPLGGITYVAVRDLDTGETTPIAEGPLGAYDPAISPDASSVVVSIRDDKGMSDLWIVDLETGDMVQLTQGGQAANATWSPDGEWLAWMSPNDRSFDIWAARIDADRGQITSRQPIRLVKASGLDATSGLSWIDYSGF